VSALANLCAAAPGARDEIREGRSGSTQHSPGLSAGFMLFNLEFCSPQRGAAGRKKRLIYASTQLELECNEKAPAN
jgi:hypothetical protein